MEWGWLAFGVGLIVGFAIAIGQIFLRIWIIDRTEDYNE